MRPGRIGHRTRAFHTTLAASFLIAWLTDFRFLSIHIAAGALAGVLLLLRFIAEIRRAEPLHGYRYSPSDLFRFFRSFPRSSPAELHNPASGSMAIALWILCSLTTLTGVLTYGAQEFQGPTGWLFAAAIRSAEIGDWIETAHRVLAHTTLAFVFAHVAGAATETALGSRNWLNEIFSNTNQQEQEK